MPEKDELDQLLDSALATYADPGADSGIEQRVLAALAADRAAAQIGNVPGWKRRWLPWAIAVPVAASLLLWVSIAKVDHVPAIQKQEPYRSDQERTPSIITPAATARPSTRNGIHPSGAKAPVNPDRLTARLKSCPVTELASAASAGAESTSCPVARTVSDATYVVQNLPRPKLDVFPTPQPLSSEERGLAVVALQAPVPLRKALVEAQEQDDAPVHIAAIHIPPLESHRSNQP